MLYAVVLVSTIQQHDIYIPSPVSLPTLTQPTQKLELREGFTKQNQGNIIGLEIMKKAEIIIALTTPSKPVSNSALVKWV